MTRTGAKCLEILLHHKAFALTVFALIVTTAGVFTFTQPKIYQVESDVYVASKPGGLERADTEEITSGFHETRTLNNQMEIVKSDAVIEQAVARVQKELGNRFPVSAAFFKGAVQVGNKEDTNVLTLRLTSGGNPELLPRVLKLYIDVFREYLRKINSHKAAEERMFLEKRLRESEEAVLAHARHVSEFETSNQAYNLDTQVENLLDKQHALAENRNAINADIAATIQEISAAKAQLNMSPELVNLMARIERDPESDSLRRQIVVLEASRAEWAAKVTGRHPKLVSLDTQLVSLREMLQKRLHVFTHRRKELADASKTLVGGSPQDSYLANEIINGQIKLQTLIAKRGVMESTVDQIEAALKAMPERRVRHGEIQARFGLASEKMKELQKKLDDAILAEEAAANFTRLEVLNEPRVPTAPIRPDFQKTMTAATLLGLCFSLFAVFVRASMDSTLRWPFQLVGALGGREDAVFPVSPPASELEMENLLEKTNFSVPESHKRLIIHLEALARERGLRRLGIITLSPFEGANLAVVELGLYLTELGHKVALIDTDPTPLSLSRQLGALGVPMARGLREGAGLTDYLANRVEDFVDVIHPLGKSVYGSFIPYGSEPGFAFSQKNLERLEGDLSPNYAFVLHSLASVERTCDALAVCRRLDGVLLLAHPGVTSLPAIRQAIQELEAIQCPIVGALVQPLS